jgi:hypothetical protein
MDGQIGSWGHFPCPAHVESIAPAFRIGLGKEPMSI